jgi:hypothetical protein
MAKIISGGCHKKIRYWSNRVSVFFLKSSVLYLLGPVIIRDHLELAQDFYAVIGIYASFLPFA